ncbi:DUF1016 N-terminal domain-containing protein [Planctomycetota bacterium]
MAEKRKRRRAATALVVASKESQLAAELPEELHNTYQELREVADTAVNHMLSSYYRIGEIVERDSELIREANRNAGLRRSELFEQLAAALGWNSKTLRDCQRFVKTFDKREFQSLLDQPVNWAHVRLLLSIPTRPERKQLLDATVQNGWTADDLAREIIRLKGNRREGSGRGRAVPANVGKALCRLLTNGDRYLKDAQSILFGADYDIATEIAQGPPDHLTEATQNQALQAIQMLENIASDAQENANRIRQTMGRFDRVFAAREEDHENEEDEESVKQDFRILPESAATK